MKERLFDLHDIVVGALAETDALQSHPDRDGYPGTCLWDVGICLDKARLALRAMLGSDIRGVEEGPIDRS